MDFERPTRCDSALDAIHATGIQPSCTLISQKIRIPSTWNVLNLLGWLPLSNKKHISSKKKVTLLGTGTHHRRLHEFIFTSMLRRNQLKGLVEGYKDSQRVHIYAVSCSVPEYYMFVCLYISVYICIYIYTSASLCTYIHKNIIINAERERERGQKRERFQLLQTVQNHCTIHWSVSISSSAPSPQWISPIHSIQRVRF